MFFGESSIFLLDLTPVWNFCTFESIHLPSQMHIQLKGMISCIPAGKITLKGEKNGKQCILFVWIQWWWKPELVPSQLSAPLLSQLYKWVLSPSFKLYFTDLDPYNEERLIYAELTQLALVRGIFFAMSL